MIAEVTFGSPQRVENSVLKGLAREQYNTLLDGGVVVLPNGMILQKIKHDPDESCQACGSYSHNTWACPQTFEY